MKEVLIFLLLPTAVSAIVSYVVTKLVMSRGR
jgi:hypothetical protein